MVIAVPVAEKKARGRTRSGAKAGGATRCCSGYVVLAAATTAGTATTAVSAAPKTGFVPDSLRDAAQKDPNRIFEVVIQGSDGSQFDQLRAAIDQAQKKHPGKARGLRRKFKLLPSVVAEVTGAQLNDVATSDGVAAVTEDAPVRAAAYGNLQNWPQTIGTQWGPAPKNADFPTIAVVDSGIQVRSDFSGRIRTQVDFTGGDGNSSGDGFGHGTLVAGLAAGGVRNYTGVEPRADIVSLDVLDDQGAGRVSDVLAACDWILQNKDKYDIRIANFSINAGSDGGVQNDPLDRAVEALWLNGVVVVTAAGNYAVDGAESGVGYAPANDPFVITVGASDTNNTASASDDFAAPWSAWGPTQDGFRKPELSAPGRVLNGPAPVGSTMYPENPTRKVADGYMWMSGTSFAAPVRRRRGRDPSSRHPGWTPDQVKGALMSSASVPNGYNSIGALGVGIVNITGAIAASGLANPNVGLNRFVVTDAATGLMRFDAAGWAADAATNAAWNQASWSSASWSSASWSSASWSSASWSSASWSSASWSSASWSSASWSSASWASMFGAE